MEKRSEFERLAPRLYLAHKQEQISIEATQSAYRLTDAYRGGDPFEIFLAQSDLNYWVAQIKQWFRTGSLPHIAAGAALKLQ